jgi:hypothetical protein
MVAPFSEEELARIVAREKPGYTLAERAPQADVLAAPADAVGPSLTTLRSKYARPDASFVDVSAAADHAPTATEPDAAPTAATAEDALVVVRPSIQDAYRGGPGPKAVLISGKTGRIIAEQG